MRALFLSYDGLTSHIGQSQVWPYVEGLAGRGHAIDVLSFEPAAARSLRPRVAAEVAAAGVTWHPRPFRSRPPLVAKLIDQTDLVLSARRVAARRPPDLVHCRGYVTARAGLDLKRRLGIPFVFDTRGFWVDQRREGGRWPDSSPFYRRLYRSWKARERSFVAGADAIVVLSEAARAEIAGWPEYRGQPLAVVPCALDFDRFPLRTPAARAAARAHLGLAADATVLVYLGSLGTVYFLTEMLRFFAALKARRPGARMLLIGPHDAAEIAAHGAAAGLPVEPADIVVAGAPHREVHALLAAGDLAISFITPTYSSLGVSPTKVGEYLAVGLPLVSNDRIGDVAAQIAATGAGMVLPDLAGPTIERAAGQVGPLLALDPAAIRRRAEPIFAMPHALGRYDALWRGQARRAAA